MFDTIPDIAPTDTLSFFLKRDVPSVGVDAQPIDFSCIDFLKTDFAGILSDAGAAVYPAFTGFAGTALPFSPLVQSIIFLLFLACLFVFSIVYRNEGNALVGNFKNIFSGANRRQTSIYKHQITTAEIWGEFFLIFQTVLILSVVIFIYLWDVQLSLLPLQTCALAFGGIFVGLALFLGFRFVLYKLIGGFLPGSEMKQWIARYFWIVELSGILIFIPALFFVYVREFQNVALLVLAGIFLLSRTVALITLLIFFVKNKIGILYFIAYLCAVEIVPYLFLYKGAVSLMSIIGSIA